jgi:hypothetical protein
MTKRKRLLGIVSLFLMLTLAMMMTACGSKTEAEPEAEEPQQEVAEEEAEPEVEAVKVIEEIDTEDMVEVPLQIESITLFEDGSLRIVPTEDLLKNAETNNEVVDGAIYPFADSGKVKDIYVVHYGNGGFRTILALIDDGTISAVNGNALINDHIIAVMNNLAGRDNFVSVENVAEEDAISIVGHTEDGEDIVLDYSLDFSE